MQKAPLAAIASPSQLAELGIDAAAVRSGDLVFRRGRSWASEAVDWADEDGELSHVGIALRHRGRVFVVHAAPGEGGGPGDRAGDRADGSAGEAAEEVPVRLEALERFLAPRSASAAALRRLRQVPESGRAVAEQSTRRAAREALGYARYRVPFDDDFDDSTEDRLYCTELVLRAYEAANIQLVSGEPRRLTVPWGPEQVWLPSQLLHSPLLWDPMTWDPRT
ncbi:MAG: YiiX/YebB-like N1pC/P60 family cysteine hydrolase [Acidobacteriota bacterium]